MEIIVDKNVNIIELVIIINYYYFIIEIYQVVKLVQFELIV